MDWDAAGNEEKARERRIAERRERVRERLRLQQQQRQADGGLAPSAEPSAAGLPAAAKGKQQAQCSAEAVRLLMEEAHAEMEAVQAAAEQRTEQHREHCDTEEASLREQVATEADASRRENRAIDLEWEKLQGIAAPQELHAGILTVAAHCQQVLDGKDAVLGAICTLLRQRDEQYVGLLRQQSKETDALIAVMRQQHELCKGAAERELEVVEAAYLQERAELLAAQKAELAVLLERRSALEQEFMEQYLAACEQYEDELERLRKEGLQEHGLLKRKLQSEVAALELHLDGVRAAYMLNADKLDYNYRVLVERERESKEALMQQKRKITRQWEVLNRLRMRYAALDGRAAADNARLADELQGVARAFNHLQSKFRHFKAADLTRFDKVRAMKEEELEGLLGQLLEAEHLISSFVAGFPVTGPGTEEAGSGSSDGAGSGGLGLDLVGQAVVVDLLAAAAATTALGPCEAPGEVVVVPAQQGPLIAAYHPGRDVEPSAEGNATAAAAGEPARQQAGEVDPLAWAELSASADSGALSLLQPEPGKPGKRQPQNQKVRQLLEQVPTAEDGRLSAGAVARSLGLQHPSTTATLGLLFAGSSSLAIGAGLAAGLADTIQPCPGSAESAAPSSRPDGGADAAAAQEQTYSLDQAEQGLLRLLQLLLPSTASAAVAGAAATQAPGVAPAGPQPTSRQYWQARAAAALPVAVTRSWELLEQQASQQFATLQGRTADADQVLALRAENVKLKATLAELLSSPLNKELQLPPTLLLR